MSTVHIFKSESRKRYANLIHEKAIEYLEVKRILSTDKDNTPTKEIDKKVIEQEQDYGDVKVPVELVVFRG
ncbi:hypothetical protein BJ944DRAFT_239344 [Cunninghamella echinulata]|nr:hypothetical protein BJ944DRAFT_239344 [Cunninghamella echinulata]